MEEEKLGERKTQSKINPFRGLDSSATEPNFTAATTVGVSLLTKMMMMVL